MIINRIVELDETALFGKFKVVLLLSWQKFKLDAILCHVVLISLIIVDFVLASARSHFVRYTWIRSIQALALRLTSSSFYFNLLKSTLRSRTRCTFDKHQRIRWRLEKNNAIEFRKVKSYVREKNKVFWIFITMNEEAWCHRIM